jgi:hypothetical protein
MPPPDSDTKSSPEIKKLIEKLAPKKNTGSAQNKYEQILERKKYDLHCFMECVLLRLDSDRGTQNRSNVQEAADKTFIQMLEHIR